MDKTTAEKILRISMDCTQDVNGSVQRVMNKCDTETLKIYRRCGGKIMGYLFTEIIAPIQSEHKELAPPDFEPMEPVGLPSLMLAKEMQDELVRLLNDQYTRINAMAEVVRDNCEPLETAIYRGRIHQVLVHVSEAMACVLAARIGPG